MFTGAWLSLKRLPIDNIDFCLSEDNILKKIGQKFEITLRINTAKYTSCNK